MNFYDVHGGGKFDSGKFQLVNGAKEITVNGNGDNSIQTNAFNVNQGANCVNFPVITTSAQTPVTVGGTITDTATVSGSASGQVTYVQFHLFAPGDSSCSGPDLYTGGRKSVTGNGSVTSDPVQATQAGDYHWTAQLFDAASDGNQLAATGCGDTGETSQVNKAQPAIVTSASGPVTIGEPISDTATISNLVSPDGTGTIKFTAYAPNADGSADTTCSTAVYTNTVTGINANGSYGSGSFTPSGTAPQIARTYEWIASYSGDGNNLAASTTCGDSGEQSLVNKAQPGIVTSASEPVTIGVDPYTISDTATLSGGSNPTGTITFTAYAPLTNGNADTTCTTSVYSNTVTVNGNGSYSSGSFTPQVAGTYEWIASYSGDANNDAVSTSGGDSGEQSVVNRHPSTVPTGQKVVVSDFANVSSSVGTPTGTVDFHLFQEPSSGCTANMIYDSGPVTLDANGHASTNDAATQPPTLSANGTYSWLVTYTPASDSSFTASSSPCGTEQLTISGNTPGVDP